MAAGTYGGSKRKKKRNPYAPTIRPFRESGGQSPSGGTESGWVGANQNPVPNINDILARNPAYQAIHAQNVAGGISSLAQRDAALRRAYIDFGYDLPAGGLDPDTAAALSHILDPTTKELAAKNTAAGLSLWARLQSAGKQTKKTVVDTLAGRGMFNSGETGYGLKNAQLQQDQQTSDAVKNLMDYFAGVQAAFAESERQRLIDEANARKDAVDESDGSVTMINWPRPQMPTSPVISMKEAGVMWGNQGNIAPPTKAPPKKKTPPRYNPPGFQGGK